MTQKQENTAKNTDNGNTPSHIVWFVQDRGKDQKAIWHRVGAQWPTKSGKGFRQTMKFFPNAEGQIVVLPYEPKSETTKEAA